MSSEPVCARRGSIGSLCCGWALEKGRSLDRVQVERVPEPAPEPAELTGQPQARTLPVKAPPLPAGPEICTGIISERGGV